jgi:non-ribosomal peptide synthetase component E (peptide arylation enzyme)
VRFRNAGATELDKTSVGKIDKKRLRERYGDAEA